MPTPSAHSARLLMVLSAVVLIFASWVEAADNWTPVAVSVLEGLTNRGVKLPWPGGCSGVVANRLTGEVTVKVVGGGLWRSSDVGRTWRQIDGDKVSGRDETGWATSVDPNDPTRMVSFSLDGNAGWTTDGSHWASFTTLGRNWDYGSVDWGARVPKTIVAAKHETTPAGEVYVTTDGGLTWKQLTIHLNESRDRISMVGALDATTLVYSKGDGVWRSADVGGTWVKVASANPQTRIPVLFQGTHYLGTAVGLLASKDKGATWQTQGVAVNIWQGPFFGRNEAEMLVVGSDGAFLTRDGGDTWMRATSLKPPTATFTFAPNWFGCYAWDPVNRLLYASAMGNFVYRFELGGPGDSAP